jgi:hypothetical protein
MSTTDTTNRFTTLPDDQTVADTAVALEEHGFGVDIVDSLEAARGAVLARIPKGSSVMTNTSVTLQETGIADAINGSGQADYSLGSVHAVTREGALFIASASGSQLASYVWGAANVIFVIGAQKLVSTAEAARERIFEHSLKLEQVRAYATYGFDSYVGKILEIHQEQPGRIHVVLIRQVVGF